MRNTLLIVAIALLLFLFSCTATDKKEPVLIDSENFNNVIDGREIELFTLQNINNHILQINADNYTPVDEILMPAGEIAPVEGTPMDFRMPTPIGQRIDNEFEQLEFGNGYDHNWVLLHSGEELNFAARVFEPTSGRTLEVYTNEPGLQFYGGNFLDGSDTGKYDKNYEYRGAFCLETQHFPDSPNKEEFPSTILNPGEEYYSVCVYEFGVEK